MKLPINLPYRAFDTIQTSLLGRDDGIVRCRRVIRLGLDFGDGAPVDALYAMLEKRGFSKPEHLREVFGVPGKPLICGPLPSEVPRIVVRHAKPDDVLYQALLLGLTTAYMFDPGRPVIWTTSSVTRGVELFDPEGFYA